MDRRQQIERLVLEELRRRRFTIGGGDPSTALVVERDGKVLSLSLENIARNALRDGDAASILAFVDALGQAPAPLPDWPQARPGLRLAAEPADSELGDATVQQISPRLVRALAYTDADERLITYLGHEQLQRWSISDADAIAVAASNLDRLLASAEVEVSELSGHPMVLLATDSVFKASLIFAPGLQAAMEPVLGWPIFAVAPCRDFLLLFPERGGDELVPRLGATVLREYNQSGYPVTDEVLRISDAGVRAVGAFRA